MTNSEPVNQTHLCELSQYKNVIIYRLRIKNWEKSDRIISKLTVSISPFSMYLVKYNASPGLPPSLYDSKRGYGLMNEPLLPVNMIETLKNIANKRILI